MEKIPWDDDQERLLKTATQIFANFDFVKTRMDMLPHRAQILADHAKWLAAVLIDRISFEHDDE